MRNTTGGSARRTAGRLLLMGAIAATTTVLSQAVPAGAAQQRPAWECGEGRFRLYWGHGGTGEKARTRRRRVRPGRHLGRHPQRPRLVGEEQHRRQLCLHEHAAHGGAEQIYPRGFQDNLGDFGNKVSSAEGR